VSQLQIEPERRAASGTPRWVKVLGVIALVIVLFVVIMHLTGNSLGGYDMHAMPTAQGAQQP
jgi:hypothetical protein